MTVLLSLSLSHNFVFSTKAVIVRKRHYELLLLLLFSHYGVEECGRILNRAKDTFVQK